MSPVNSKSESRVKTVSGLVDFREWTIQASGQGHSRAVPRMSAAIRFLLLHMKRFESLLAQ